MNQFDCCRNCQGSLIQLPGCLGRKQRKYRPYSLPSGEETALHDLRERRWGLVSDLPELRFNLG